MTVDVMRDVKIIAGKKYDENKIEFFLNELQIGKIPKYYEEININLPINYISIDVNECYNKCIYILDRKELIEIDNLSEKCKEFYINLFLP